MMRKMFNCPNCGLISEIYGNATNVNCNIYLSHNSKGNIIREYDNYDVVEFDGWYCPDCDAEVNKNDVEEIEISEVNE